jgi:hypothetical protein
MILSVACALPGIHRDPAGPDASPPEAVVEERELAPDHTDDPDAGGLPDPRSDPANLNEDYETFRSLVPKNHVFAEWPMPDTSPYSKAKPSYTITEQVIVDNVTKLRWQAKLPTIYPGCTANYEFVGRLRGVGTGCTWEQAQAYCASPELAEKLGGGPWRVPTIIELQTLIDVSRVNAVDALFDDFPIDSVWTSSPYPNTIVDGLKMSWQVDFMDGASGPRGRAKGSRVRCVSSSNDKGGSVQRLEFSVTGIAIRDAATRLEWQRRTDSATRNWPEAVQYCRDLALDGGGWHLPSLKELLTIVDSTRHEPAINLRMFELHLGESFWTSSEYINGRGTVYLVNFADGSADISSSHDELHYVRCVR